MTARKRTAGRVIQEHPVKTAAAVVTSLGVIIGGFLYADERWVHAAEFKQFAAQTNAGLEVNRLTSEIGSMETQIGLLQQRIALMRAGKNTDKVALSLAESELSTKTQDLSTKKQLLDKLRTGK